MAPASPRPARSAPLATPTWRVLAGLGMGLGVACLLLSSLVGGLLRAGVAVPVPDSGTWPAQAVVHHAFLMMSAFMGSVIALERAVAVKHRAAFVAPLLSLLSGVALVTGGPFGVAALAGGLAVVAALAFVAVNVVVVRRQAAAHTGLLLAGALAWLVGNSLWALNSAGLWALNGAGLWAPGGAGTALPWWFGFLVLTIAAERLEMTRLMRQRPAAASTLALCVLGLLAGALTSVAWPRAGGLLYGLALAGLALWLGVFDIARRTIRARGLPRYMALCLLLGYGWLGVAGLAWAAWATGASLRDMALHALGLGFVFGMVMGHAPVILPALTRQKLQFGIAFYAPLAALHGSLLWRFGAGFSDLARRADGAQLNALALLWFALTVVGAIVVWRLRHSGADTALPRRRRA